MVSTASSNKPVASSELVSTALVALRFKLTTTVAPPAALIVNTGLLALVEPALRAIVPPVAATEPEIYSIPAASLTSNSPVVLPAGILKVIVSVPTEKSALLAKCTGL